MIVSFLLIFFIIGLFFGSFLNVVVDRLPEGKDIFFGRSHCPYCQHVLAWYDLIPIISYALLLGRCRYCKKFIGFGYPIIEMITGIAFALTALMVGFSSSLGLITALIIVSCLIVIFYTDLFSGIIPDGVLVTLFVFSLGQKFLVPTHWLAILLTGLFTGLGFLLLFLITRQKGIGFGDVKYAFVMGVLLGFPGIIPALYIAFLTGAVCALILVIAGKKKLKSTIPFGPFLVLGTFLTLIWGQELILIFQKILGI